ncbi:MAG: hypothetical protein EWM72_01597 [Nitrospira sp.]|nr:MAG: hypothetical protein EWM72_01597 [Nitrospira sp.]
MRNRCWAASLGGCSEKLSREHIISAAFFEGNNIKAAGFDWTGDKVAEISLKNAVVKVLCKSHNSKLSELDTEIRKISECFSQFNQAVVGGADSSKHSNQFVGQVNGVKFERWLLKTTLNVICASPKKYISFWPDEFLASLVFGKIKFDYHTGMGLYFIHPNLYGNLVSSWNFVNVRPAILTIEGDTGLIGAIISFWGMPFFLKVAASTENLCLNVKGLT